MLESDDDFLPAFPSNSPRPLVISSDSDEEKVSVYHNIAVCVFSTEFLFVDR